MLLWVFVLDVCGPASSLFGQKIRNELIKAVSLLDLGPVAASTENVQLRPVYKARQFHRHAGGHYSILTPMNNERFVRNRADVLFRAG
jgi:hypothetical protein